MLGFVIPFLMATEVVESCYPAPFWASLVEGKWNLIALKWLSACQTAKGRLYYLFCELPSQVFALVLSGCS